MKVGSADQKLPGYIAPLYLFLPQKNSIIHFTNRTSREFGTFKEPEMLMDD